MHLMRKTSAAKQASIRSQRRPRDAFTKPKGQWHHGDLRASLIAWGTHLLDTEGSSAMSMRAAAKLAGVSQGAPAHHFVDRNGLLAAIAAQGFRDMVRLRKEYLEQTDPEDKRARLRAVMLGYVEFALRYPARFHLMFGPDIEHRDQYPELVEATEDSIRLLKSAVAPLRAGKTGQGTSETAVAFAVWAITHGLATLAINQGRTNHDSPNQQSPNQDRTVDRYERNEMKGREAEIVVQFCLAALESDSLRLLK
jgi:AcrR family transcriptional regulator